MKGDEKLYLALYRKYRPQTFDDVISQEHITTTLRNQLKNGQTSHAYLFTGSRGTGKTTCAKILAKAINCLNKENGNPCLECEACKAVAEETTDIIEMDAASNTGVDSIRELKEGSVYTPISCCKYKIYIIDEVHMLSTAAFNALLKLIEEPPPHVVFIFATTELHKVPATIVSRCQRFEFRRIDIEDSKKRLIEIAEKEGATLDPEAAFLISRISDGGMRDALSLLDQCLSAGNHITEAIVRSCSGISGTEHLFGIADAVIEENCPKALNILDGLVQRSKSPLRLMEELIAHYRILMLLKAGSTRSVLRISADEEKGYLSQNNKYSMESILRAISILSEALSGKNRSKNEQLTCEMCLIRLCSPDLDVDEKAFSNRIDKLERTVRDLALNGIKTTAAEAVTDLPVNNEVPAAEESPFMTESIKEEAAVTAEPAPEVPPQPVINTNGSIIPLPTEENPPPSVAYDDIIPPPWEENPPAAAEELIPLPFDGIPAPAEEPAVLSEETTDEPFKAEPVSLSEAVGLEPSRKPAEETEAEEKTDGEVWKKEKPKTEEFSEEGFVPFPQWKRIISEMGLSIELLIGNTEALIKDNTVMVCGAEHEKSYVTGQLRGELQDAVSKAIGTRVSITAQKGAVKAFGEEENYVNDFLGFAKSQGVIIKEVK